MSLLREAQEFIANQAARRSLNAFVSLAERPALFQTIKDAEAKRGRGPINGKLIAVKDNICTSDLPTTAASGILKSFTSPYDATVIRQLRDAGGIVAGKTNLDEFGMGSHSIHSFFGPVWQSRNNSRVLTAGGSSGGSAVAVATKQSWAALGTDTGGSVRLPAAYTGIVGYKPSYGLVSRWGVIAYANSLDTIGIFARDSRSAQTLFNAINSHDPKDPTSLLPSTRTQIAELLSRTNRKTALRIGVPLEYNINELQPVVRQAWVRTVHLLTQLGHTIYTVSLPTTKHALSAYYVLAPAEASSNLAKYDGVRFGSRYAGPDASSETDSVLFSKTRRQGFGSEVKRRILLGAYTLSAEAIDNYFIQAQKVRRLVQRDFNRVFSLPNPLLDSKPSSAHQSTVPDAAKGAKVDVLICPTAPTLPPTLEFLDKQTPVDAYMNDVFTVPASLAGLPAVSVPVRSSPSWADKALDGEMVGIQVIAQYGDDDLVLKVAKIVEELGQ